jgi:hypothetical protein
VTREEAIRHSQRGAYAAFIGAGISGFAFLAATISQATDGLLGLMNDPLNLIDIGLVVGCGIGLLRRSRAAAVVLVAYFVIARIAMSLELGQPTGLIPGLIFLYFFARAVQGTFAFHKIERAENPSYKPGGRWIVWVGVPVGVLFLLFAVVGIMTMTGALTSTEVLPGTELRANDRAALVEAGIVDADEAVRWFYSDAFVSVLGAGNVLTDRRVIRYFEDGDGKLAVYALALEEIASIELLEPGGALADSVYKVNGHEPDTWLQLALSVENGGDAKFVEALRRDLER